MKTHFSDKKITNKSVIIKKKFQEEYITHADCGNLFYYTSVCPFDSQDC